MPLGLPLDFDALLAPVPGEEPAGSPSTFMELKSQIDDLRKEVTPDEVDPDDPTKPDKPQAADWAGIEKLTRQALAGTSKDLRLAAYLFEALVRQYQFEGLREGLLLFRGMLEHCWDRCYPRIDDGEVEVRVGVFDALDDLRTKGRTPFPNYLRMLPTISGGGRKHSFQDWVDSQQGGELADSFAKALQGANAEEGAKTAKVIEDCLSAHDALVKVIDQRFGHAGTSLSNLRSAIQDCGRVARLVTGKEAGAADKTGEERPAADGKADNEASRATGAASRAEAYRQLSEAAALLQRLEPHSPIPYLVQRAVELGALPFPQLMKALIRDANVLAELNREFGLKPEEGVGPPAA
jgi:type VI secretion system protein ImpA